MVEKLVNSPIIIIDMIDILFILFLELRYFQYIKKTTRSPKGKVKT